MHTTFTVITLLCHELYQFAIFCMPVALVSYGIYSFLNEIFGYIFKHAVYVLCNNA